MVMAAILINGPRTFEQVFNPPSTEGFTWSLKITGHGVSEKNSFKEVDGRRTNRRMDDDGREVITIAHRTFGSGELKKDFMLFWFVVLQMRMHNLLTSANSKGSGKTALTRSLAWVFAGRSCDKHPFLMYWFKCTYMKCACICTFSCKPRRPRGRGEPVHRQSIQLLVQLY